MSSADGSLDELLAKLRSDPDTDLGLLLDRYRPFLRLIASQAIGPALGRRHDPSDVVQQTCIEAVSAFPEFKGTKEPQLSAWLKQILRRNVSNLIRDNRAAKRDMRREQAMFDNEDSATLFWQEPEAGGTSPSQNVLRGEAALELATALDRLPADQRAAVSLRYLDGKSLAEIATDLGRSNSSIAGLLHRGLSTLRAKLNIP